MNPKQQDMIREICRGYGRDPTRMMDIALAVQQALGCVPQEAIDIIAGEASVPRVEVESLVSFYAFLSRRPRGRIVIRVCNDVIDRMAGADRVTKAFEEALGISSGETTPDGEMTLEHTACIGMSDQAPAALVNDVVVTNLSTDDAQSIVRRLRKHGDPKRLVRKLGDGNNADELVHAMVVNNIRRRGPVVFAPYEAGEALGKALAITPSEVIREVKTARLRGRGGAGFPTGMKWEYTRAAEGKRKYLVCNADEGEPGTFKDRVILTECPDLMLEGMTIAGYALGARSGIIYLRGEYAYLRRYLERVIAKRREKGLLGRDILGKNGFSFDVTIQMGAGAYICGEETALISSCEGTRGDPKTRPPFPAQKGYLGFPTSVNNVETFCCAARIFEKGTAWFSQLGSKNSTGTKLLSVAGDCSSPGVFEFPFGVTLREVLDAAGASGAGAVQVGGPSGQMVGPEQYDRVISYEDLATGGSIMVFSKKRNPVEVAREFMRFFVEESCGYCTPCRAGNVLLEQRLSQILEGKGEPDDIGYLKDLCETIKTASRCGLGQTSPNPVLTTLEHFRSAYEGFLREPTGGKQPAFDIHAAIAEAASIAGRKSSFFHEE